MLNSIRMALLLLVAVMLPIEYIEVFSLGSVAFGPTKVATILLTGVTLLQWLTSGQRLPWSAKHVWVLLLSASLLLSTIVSLVHGIPLAALIPGATTNLSLVLFYLVLTLAIRNERELNLFLGALVVGGAIVSLTAMAGMGYAVQAEEGAREGGLGGNVNELGFNLALMLPIAFSFVLSSTSRIWRLLAIGAITVGLVATANTLSRTTYLAALVMWIYGMVRFSRLDLMRYAVVGLIVFAVGVNFLPKAVQDRLATMTSTGLSRDSSTRERMLLNEFGLRAFVSSPAFGVGVQGFGYWAAERTGAIHSGASIHSAYLRVAAEQGLVGLIPFLAIIALTWRELGRAVSLARRGERAGDKGLRSLRLHALLLQVALLGMIIGHLAQTSFQYKATWMMPALSTVVLVAVRERVRKTAPELLTRSAWLPSAR